MDVDLQTRDPLVPSSVRKSSDPGAEFQSKQALIDDQIRAFHLKREQFMKQQQSLGWGEQADSYKQAVMKSQNKARSTLKASRANMAEENRTDSEMMAASLANQTSPRRGSCGTGVFLPRGISNTSESRKKSGYPTVLIPARVVQALRLHFDKMGAASGSNGACFPLQHDALMTGGYVRYGLHGQQKGQRRAVPTMDCHDELCLPQAWTY